MEGGRKSQIQPIAEWREKWDCYTRLSIGTLIRPVTSSHWMVAGGLIVSAMFVAGMAMLLLSLKAGIDPSGAGRLRSLGMETMAFSAGIAII